MRKCWQAFHVMEGRFQLHRLVSIAHRLFGRFPNLLTSLPSLRAGPIIFCVNHPDQAIHPKFGPEPKAAGKIPAAEHKFRSRWLML